MMITIQKGLLFSILLFGNLIPSLLHAEEFNVAVATNFRETLQQLVKTFEKSTGHQAIITADATGKLYAQIKSVAMFDILLAADVQTPKTIEAEGLGVANTRFTYAVGNLVLWSPQKGLVDSKGSILRSDKFIHLALPDPKIGPYGTAAQEVMEKLGVWQKLQSKLWFRDSMTETYQVIVSGEAELGFVALSMLKPQQKSAGSLWMVSKDLYTPMEQQAILLNYGKENKAALAFLEYLKDSEARTVIESYGYSVP